MACGSESILMNNQTELGQIDFPVFKKRIFDFGVSLIPAPVQKDNIQIQYPNGEKYIGQVDKLKKRNGIGKYYYNSGKVKYFGHFKDGERSGAGVLYDQLGKRRYVGQWENNIGEGIGIVYNKHEKISYKGKIQKGQIHGFGKSYITVTCEKCRQNSTCSDYLDYIGEFKSNKKSNDGRSYHINGKCNVEETSALIKNNKKSFKVLRDTDGTIIGYE